MKNSKQIVAIHEAGLVNISFAMKVQKFRVISFLLSMCIFLYACLYVFSEI